MSVARDRRVVTAVAEAAQRLQAGDAAAAERGLRRAIQIAPADAEALYLLGLARAGQGRVAEALTFFDRSIAENAKSAYVHFNRGVALLKLDRPAEALEAVERAFALGADFVDAWIAKGGALRAVGRLQEALDCYERALPLAPGDLELLLDRAAVLQMMGRAAEAVAALDAILSLDGTYVPALINKAGILYAAGRYVDAVAAYDAVLARDAKLGEARYGRANALRELGRVDEALAALVPPREGDESRPAYWSARGAALEAARRHDEAHQALSKGVALAPGDADLRSNLGAVLESMGRQDEALAAFDATLAVKPAHFSALLGRGKIRLARGDRDGALADFERAASHASHPAMAFVNAGIALERMGRLDEALERQRTAARLEPDSALVQQKVGDFMQWQKRYDEAIAYLERAIALNPAAEYVPGRLLMAKLQSATWDGFDASLSAAKIALEMGRHVTYPFDTLALFDDPGLQRAAADREIALSASARPGLQRRIHANGERLRVAYLSSDFRTHPVGRHIAGVIESHDRAAFEVLVVSWGADDGSETRRVVQSAADRFIDARGMSDAAVVQALRDAGVDIAVGLNGFTEDHRLGIASQRVAPVQIACLGYAGTIGGGVFDYVVSDASVLPPALEPFFTEKPLRLPRSFFPADPRRRVGPATRAEHGLPEDACVYCAFGGLYKVQPTTFDGWMRVLVGVPGSVLWLTDPGPEARARLESRATALGVDASRLRFAAFEQDPARHLGRYAIADVFLDTFPYGAHTTANDALLARLPVVTRRGATFASRVSAGMLEAAGLAELVVETPEAYERLAIELGRDPARRAALRARLAPEGAVKALFDVRGYTRDLERGYLEAYRRYASSLQPAAIDLTVDRGAS